MRIGSYQLRERVGEGGFARVYHATGPQGDVAIKVLAPIDGNLDPSVVKRFEREIEVLAKVRHPSLVSLLDSGVDSTHGPFLVMPLLIGLTLRDLIPDEGLGPEAALRLMTPVVQAMGALHAAGLVHRDLKPENVIVSPRGEVTLVDLGLALGVEQSRLTQTGAVAGSVPYMAPEQIEGDPPRAESDVWSLGVLLYELITGRRPFARDRSGEEVAAILAGSFDTVTERDRRASPELDALLRDCLRHDPEARPGDAHELLRRLEALLDWAPPAAQREEVVSLLTDLRAYQKARSDDRVERLKTAADRAAGGGDTFAALALLDRALAYHPDDRDTLSRIEAVSCAPSLPPDAIATKKRSVPPSRGAETSGETSRTDSVDAHAKTEHAVPTPRDATAIRRRAPKRSWLLAIVGVGAAVAASGLTYWLTRPDVPEAVSASEAVSEDSESEDSESESDGLAPSIEPDPSDTLEPDPDVEPDPTPIVSLDQLRPIPRHELDDGSRVDMGDNVRQPGENLVPARMLGPMGPEGALRHIERQLEARRGDPELRVGRALALLGNGREREGLAELETLSREAPELGVLWGARGYVAMRQNRLEEAERFFTRAIELDPADASSLRNRGILRHRLGERAEAYDDLRAALRYDPDDVNALAELSQIYEQTGHRRDARPLLERVVRARPRFANAWVDLSMAQSDPDEALASLDRALQINPGLRRAYVQRCTVLTKAQRSESIDACTRAMQADPDDPWIQMHRGLAHYHQGDDEAALQDMNEAVSRRPRDPVMLTNRYLVLQHAGRTVEARRDLEVACNMGHEAACNELGGAAD